MHELSLMQSVAELAEAEASRRGAEAIVRLHLRLGSLAGVDPEALRFAGEVVCSRGLLAGAHLELELIPATAFCSPCQEPFAVFDGLCLCPICGTVSAQLLQGRELELASLELRLADGAADVDDAAIDAAAAAEQSRSGGGDAI